MYDKWLVEPQSLDVKVDETEIISKSKHWMDKIDTLEKNIKTLSLEKGKELISKLKDQLKNYRKSGLEKDEMSLENLVYKFLNRFAEGSEVYHVKYYDSLHHFES